MTSDKICANCGEPITENDTPVHFEDEDEYFHFGCDMAEVYKQVDEIGVRGSGR